MSRASSSSLMTTTKGSGLEPVRQRRRFFSRTVVINDADVFVSAIFVILGDHKVCAMGLADFIIDKVVL